MSVGPKKFNKVSSGIRKYDPAKYGCYKSHADGVDNKGNLKDPGQHPKACIRYGLPIAFLVLCFWSITYGVCFISLLVKRLVSTQKRSHCIGSGG
jgi:hypothetical protein